MPADTVEILEGDEEGIERLNGWGPVEIERDDDGARHAASSFRHCLRVYDEQRRFAPVFDDGERSDRRLRHGAARRRPGARTSSFLEDGGADIEQVRPGWPQGRSGDARHDGAGRVRRRRPRARHAAADRRGGLGQGGRALGLPVPHRPRARRRDARRRTCRWSATGASAGYEAIRRVAGPGAEPDERLRAPGRAGRDSATTRTQAHARGVALPRLRRDARVRRHALRALRRLRRRLPDAVPEARAARPSSSRRRALHAADRARARRRRRPRRALGHPQGRGPLHPLRAVRHALPVGRDHDGARVASAPTWRSA